MFFCFLESASGKKKDKMVDKNKSLTKNGEDVTNEWLSEAIISFLKGPCYSVPLMSFIDEHCLVFDLEEENKFEYTTLHIEFMNLVDKLLCELLEDLGVKPEKLVSVLSSDINQNQISSFVLTSILSVEDFLQFKAMMVKRNVELTNQVIESLIEKKEQEAAKAAEEKERKDKEETEQILAENGEVDEETLLVLKLSKQQFELENSQRKALEEVDFSGVNGAEDQEEAFEKALKESLKVKSKIDQEKAELEQAMALSLALEREVASVREAAKKAEESEAAGAEPTGNEASADVSNKEVVTASEDLPVVAAQQDVAEKVREVWRLKCGGVEVEEIACTDQQDGKGDISAEIKAVEEVKDEVVQKVKNPNSLPPLVLDNNSSAPSTATPTPGSADYRRPLHSSRFQGAGYKSDSSTSLKTPTSAASSSSASDPFMDSVREAAYAAAETQKGLLQTRRENLLVKEKEAESTATKVSDLDVKRKDYIIKQRAALVAKNNAERQKQLAEFLLSSKENLFPKARESAKENQKEELPPINQQQNQSQDQQRAALRHELAKMFKQQLLREGM